MSCERTLLGVKTSVNFLAFCTIVEVFFSLPLSPEAYSCRSSKFYRFCTYFSAVAKVRVKLSCFKRWHVTVFTVQRALASLLWSVLPGARWVGEVFALNFCYAICLEDEGWHSVRWVGIMSGGLKARNTEWTLMLTSHLGSYRGLWEISRVHLSSLLLMGRKFFRLSVLGRIVNVRRWVLITFS